MKEKEKIRRSWRQLKTPSPSKKHAHQILCSCQASPPVTRTRTHCRADIRFALLLKRKAAGKGSKKKKRRGAAQRGNQRPCETSSRPRQTRAGEDSEEREREGEGETGGKPGRGRGGPLPNLAIPNPEASIRRSGLGRGESDPADRGGARAAPIRARSLLCPRGVRSCGGPRRAGSCCVLPGGCC